MEERTFTVPGLLEEAQRLQQELREERDRLRLLLDVNNLLVSRLEYPELLRTLSESIHRVVKHDSASVALFDRSTGRLKLQALTYTAGPEVVEPDIDSDARRFGRRRHVSKRVWLVYSVRTISIASSRMVRRCCRRRSSRCAASRW